MFIEQDDYKQQIKDKTLIDIIEANDHIRQQAEIVAQAEIESYLRHKYNVADIFNQSGEMRDPLIVMYLIDISLYHIFTRINPRAIPDIRIDRYNNAIEWLKKVNKGQLSPALPRAEAEDGDTYSNSIFGSRLKQGYGNGDY